MADRICLGLGLDLKLPVLTGDTTWVEIRAECEVILFRNNILLAVKNTPFMARIFSPIAAL